MNAADFQSITFPAALERLARMPSVLAAALEGASARGLSLRPGAESFCLIEHACHLRDLEIEGYAVRLRRMLDEDEPTLAGFEGDVIARERNYVAQDPHAAARQFAIARAAFVERARTLTASEMARTATVLGRRITVCDLLAMMVDHDDGHRAEIEALWK